MSIYITTKLGTELEFKSVYELMHNVVWEDIAVLEEDNGFAELISKSNPTYDTHFFKMLEVLMDGGDEGVLLYASLEYKVDSPTIFKGCLSEYAQNKIAARFNIDFDDVFILKYVNVDEYGYDLQKDEGLIEFLYLNKYYVVKE